jgi:TniQ
VGEFIPFANYLIRPAMEQGESVAGYMCRYLGANGHRIQRKYYDLMEAMYRASPGTALKAKKKIQELVGDISQLDNKYWLNHPTGYSSCLENWVPLNIAVVRICPQCLQENGFHSALWEFSLVYACPAHETALLEACTACGNKFEWAKIAPNWHCVCGEDIKAMQPKPAKSGCIALARILALAQDAIQTDGVKGRHQIISIYKRLEWGCKLANKLSPSKNYVRKYPFNRQDSIIVSLPTVAWVAKLFIKSQAELDKSVTRAIKRHFKVENSLLESFYVGDVMAEAIEFIVKNPEEYLASKIYESIERCLKKYHHPLPLEFVVLFNPKLTDENFKNSLIHFSRWWGKFSKPIASLEGKEHDALYRRLDSKNYKINVDLLIFQILKVLFNASCQMTEGKEFNPLVEWWKIPDKLRKPNPPEQALYQIGVYLKSISQTELIIAHSLLMYGQERLHVEATINC